MNTMQKNRIQSIALVIAMMALLAVLAGCERDEPTVDSAENQATVDQPARDEPARDEPARDEPAKDEPARDQQPMEHVSEFDGFTVRANVSRTDVLPDAMAQKYGIEPESDLVLINVVILESRADRQPVPVSAEVSARHESLSGHVEAIDMRAVEANGHISYIGTLDTSGQRSVQLIIEAQPAGTDQPLRMDFEVQLDAFEMGDTE